ncbi:MAG: hypothetical protein IJZ33_01915 [Clostridia bacterium]|nr:hypothetical protein [Clostridia bacterium]
MMYSRKFGVDLPAGYGGVALREQRQQAREQDGQRVEESDAQREEEPRKQMPPLDGRPFSNHEPQGAAPSLSRAQEEESRRPRYPLYEGREWDPPYSKDRPPREERGNFDGGRSEEKTGGLLSSLFSLAGKSFTMEDIVLAGLILLLLNEKGGKEGVDSELLLILGLLLMSGKG